MRTKSLLVMAAALAAGVVAASAQSNVYSLNIVGYVNKVIPSGYSLIANPLSAGVTNGANEIMSLVDGSIYLTWNGTSFDYTSYDTGFGGWVDVNSNPSVPPSLPPGKGFFFYNSVAQYTNTWVGSVVPAPGATNNLSLPSGYSLIGSVLPVGGPAITAAPVSLPLLDGLVILKWTGSSYAYSGYDTGFGGWIDVNSNPSVEPGYTVGEGFFFYNPVVTTPWTQYLP